MVLNAALLAHVREISGSVLGLEKAAVFVVALLCPSRNAEVIA
jgi:hypothetical protein